MKVRLSTKNDLIQIKDSIIDAQKYLASLNIDQWQDGYPDERQILQDIALKESYVVEDDKEIIGTFMFTTRVDPNYKSIQGEWLVSENEGYGVVHRIAVREQHRGKGFANFVFDFCEKQLLSNEIPSFKIDTHKDNKGMQHLLEKRNFDYCGIITLSTGGLRMAYEKVLLPSFN